MRLLYFLVSFLVVCASCKQKPKHPQAEIINRGLPATITEQAIIQFADSINANLASFEKQSSLVFQRADSSFYVEKYSINGSPVLFRTFSENAGIKKSSTDYYFNSDSLILVKESTNVISSNGQTLEEKRIYLRNNIAFKKERRTGLSASSLNQKKFTVMEQVEPVSDLYSGIVAKLNDAVNGTNEFELVFDNLISSPGDNHIVLKSKVANGYSGSITVLETDAFIDSLAADPLHFKDEKLNINWKVKDKEAIYVPVATKTTSASGLNK